MLEGGQVGCQGRGGSHKTDREWARARDEGGGDPLPLERFLFLSSSGSISRLREHGLWGDKADFKPSEFQGLWDLQQG